MKALVTGGLGFIGSHLAERLLADGHSVAILDLPNLSFINSFINVRGFYRHTSANFLTDIADCSAQELANFLKIEYIDWVFHLAGKADVVPSINEPLGYFHANVTGTLNMLEAARRAGVKKFVYASSSSVYGIYGAANIPTNESAPIRPEYPYAETKYQGERWVSHYDQVYRLPTVSLRLFNVYGPRSRTTGAYGAVFGTFLAQKINQKPLTVVGNGLQSRDFVYVTDVCDAFVKAAKSPISGEIYNIGAGKPQTILRLAELIGGEIVNLPKRPGEPDITCADISKAEIILNWKPVVSFETGVKIMLDNIDYWKDAPVWTPETIKEATKTWFEFLEKEQANGK